MELDSLLTGENAAFLDAQYLAWLDAPDQVDPAWRVIFEALGPPTGPRPALGPSSRPPALFGGPAAATAGADPRLLQLVSKVPQLINAYRVRGHIIADIDPLDRREHREYPELTLGWYGLDESALDVPVPSSPIFGEPEQSTLRRILARLRRAYCGTLGVEFMNIQDLEQRRWVQQRVETLWDRPLLDHASELRVLRKLCDAEGFERLLHARFPGTKRFSLEGAEGLIPLLDLLIERSAASGVREIVFGMAHRGRLNVLANTLEKPLSMIIREFEDSSGKSFQGSGDVKYHLGYSSNCTTASGQEIHLSLAFNPSHLEAVNPVVEGRVRAKHDRAGGGKAAIKLAMPVLLHGDAAFAGQGTVAEVLNLSDLAGYRTGGTLHIIVNNQIGFTTPPHEARSTPYATDVARMLAVPILHVNGEDPLAVAAAVQVAVDWRQTFHRDVVIDMYCFRKHGHNEGDEPSFTQPLLYDTIRSHPTAREVYTRRLIQTGLITQEEADRVNGESRERLERQSVEAQNKHDSYIGNTLSPMGQRWAGYGGDLSAPADTRVDLGTLRDLLTRANTLPEGFNAHPKIRRLLQQRLETVRGERPVDWAVAEQAAYATLVVEGYRVRISGQDSGRGTFSHRHAVLTDITTGAERFPLDHLVEGQARFQVMDSMLSEVAVLGFEYGYSLDYPDALVVWEAQFGDFANGAQVIIDQFISAGEQKWNRRSGLVMLLPHGYEGQGPEHSSAKIERYLLLCAEDNMQIANCTTPASFFHLLRRQGLRPTRKPLVVFSPKSLLRHPECVSTLEELAGGAFQPVLGEPEALDPAQVRRVVLCQGKVFYDLLAERRARGQSQVALVRVEELYPFPGARIAEELARYPGAEVVWCQEEPRNMGCWPMFDEWLAEALPAGRPVRYVGRRACASPATGSPKQHAAEQKALLNAALTLE